MDKMTTNNKQKPPCQNTPSEMIERIEQGLKDAKAGKGKTVEQMRKLHPRT